MPSLDYDRLKKINPGCAIFGGGNRQLGIAIIWIVVIMVAISSAGVAMLRLYSVSTAGWLDAHASGESKAMADSGYRFLLKEYRLQPNEKEKNELLDELNNARFQLAAGSDGRFELDISSYFYRVETDPGGAASLRLKFVGQGGFTVPASGFLKLDQDDTLYQYTSQSEAGGVYTFTMTQGVSPAPVYTTVRPVVRTSINAVSQGGTLTLGSVGSGLGGVFPEENGMFLIEKEEIKESLPVKTTVPYRYEYRTGDQLVNVRKGPNQSGFIGIDSDSSAAVELAKLLTVDSIGTYGDTASKTSTYQLSMDHGSFTSGLKNYWSFDSVPGTDVPDDYGVSPGELAGGTAPTLAVGKVGSALYFSGAGYVATTLNPSSATGAGRPFTIVFWAKPDLVAEGALRVALGSYEFGALTKYFFIGTQNGKWVWALGNYFVPGDPGLPDVKDDSDGLNIGNWQHVAYVYDGNNIFIYINGIKEYELLGFGTSAALPDLGVSLGALNTSGGTSFNFVGTLDEIAIFDRALDICEIREIYEVPCNTGCGVFYLDDPDTGYSDGRGIGKIPVMYLPFNGNGMDESGVDKDGPYNNDATPVGATLTADRFGCPNKAYSLEGGNHYLRVAHSPSLDMGMSTKRVTVAAWVKKASNQSGNIAVVQKSDTSYILRFDDDYASFIIDPQDAGKKWAWMRTPLPPGQWYHLVGTYDWNAVRIYVDGRREDRNDYAGYVGVIGDDYDYDVGIGENLDRTGRYLDGKIDDVAIWDRALTDKQVEAYYNATSHK